MCVQRTKLSYQISQYVDLVEEHLLLVLVHMALTQNFNCPLGTGVSVNAHPHFSEGAYTQDRLVYLMFCLPLPSIFPIL